MGTAIEFRVLDQTGLRAEVRTDTIRIVEYAEFPRRAADGGLRMGFTRDISASGVCLGADQPESVGSLLRLGIRALDGSSVDARIGRVAWTTQARDGRHWIGVELLTKAGNPAVSEPPALVRRLRGGSGLRSD